MSAGYIITPHQQMMKSLQLNVISLSSVHLLHQALWQAHVFAQALWKLNNTCDSHMALSRHKPLMYVN